MRLITAAVVALGLATAGCSLQQQRTLPSPPASTSTTIIRQNQALNWSVVSSYYASNQVVLSYPLCPRQHLIGRPEVKASAEGVAITLWANPRTCASPSTQQITIHLPGDLGHRALTNPGLY